MSIHYRNKYSRSHKMFYTLSFLILLLISGWLWFNYALPQNKYYIPVSKIYVINLDKNTDRLDAISKGLKSQGLEFTRFPAILGLNLKIETEKGHIFTGQDLKDGKENFRIGEEYKIYCPNITLNYKYIPELSEGYGNPLSAGEFGLYCSHLEVMLDVVKHGYKSVVVFEDDATIPYNFAKELKLIEANMPNYKKYDVIFLGGKIYDYWHSKLKTRKIMFNESLDKVTDYTGATIWCTYAIMYGYYGAKNILSNIEPHAGIDIELYKLINKGVLQAFQARRLDIYPAGNQSEINNMGRTINGRQ